jgi:hypothetical protein
MGVFNFLKKPKADTSDTGMELPPVPKMEGTEGFPEMKTEEVPALPDSSLPPLPTELPGEVPPAPEEKELETPKVDMPKPPIGAEPKKVETQLPEIPEFKEEELPEELPEAPALPDVPEAHKIGVAEKPHVHPTEEAAKEEAPKPTFPELPEHPAHDVVPDKVPPLEGLPDAPAFIPEEPSPVVEEAPAPEPMKIPEEALPTMEYLAEDVTPLKRRVPQGPLYIQTDRVRAVLDDIEQIKAKFKAEDDVFFRINEVKSNQDQRFEDFRQTLEDMQRKLLFIDRSLFEVR